MKMRKRAFTLIELLLVLAIIGVATAVSFPYLINAMRGSKLRTAAREVVMSCRYARSMALLKQSEMIVRYDLTTGRITVSQGATGRQGNIEEEEELPVPAALTRQTLKASSDRRRADDERLGLNEQQSAVEVERVAAGETELSRALDGIRIEYVEADGAERTSKGSCSILYRSNGTCFPHTVKLRDERGPAILVRIDNLSSARTEPGGL